MRYSFKQGIYLKLTGFNTIQNQNDFQSFVYVILCFPQKLVIKNESAQRTLARVAGMDHLESLEKVAKCVLSICAFVMSPTLNGTVCLSRYINDFYEV